MSFGWLHTRRPECPGTVGDMIEFRRGNYSHWAINAGNNEVIHLIGDAWGSFTSATFGTMLPQVRYESFAVVDQDAKSGKGKKLEGSVVCVNNTSRDYLPRALPPQAIVERALSQVGEKGYHLLYNNCEHFATWSRHGRGHSKQTLIFYQPIPSGGTREEVDSRLGYLRSAERHTWVIVMTSKKWHPTDDKRRQLKSEFPMHELQDRWREGESISILGTTSKQWFLSWRLDDGKCQTVKLFGRGLHPKDTIKELVKWVTQCSGKGQIVTKVGCHGGILVAVAEQRHRNEEGRIYYYQGKFNKSYIEQEWREGRMVHVIAYFNSWWIMITSTHQTQGQQACIFDNQFPEKKIRKYWDDGFCIQAMAAGPQWVIIMLKTENSARMEQYYRMSEEFPDDFLQSKWDKDMVITAVTGN